MSKPDDAPRPEFGALLEETFKGSPTPPAEGGTPPPAEGGDPAPEGKKTPVDPFEEVAKKVAGEDPEPKKEDLPPDAPDEELEKEYPTPQGFTEKAGQAWKRVRGELHSAKQKVKALEQEVEKAKAAPPTPDNAGEVEALKARLAEAEEVLAGLNVEATSEFKEAVSLPRKGIMDTVAALTKKYGIDSSELSAVMSDDSKVDELGDLVASFSERDRLRVYAMAEDLQRIDAHAAALKSNSRQTMEALEAGRRERTEKEIQAARAIQAKAAENVWTKVRQTPLLQEIEGADEWNEGIKKIDTFVRGLDFGRLTPEEVYAMAYQGAAYPRALDAVSHYSKENRALRAQLAKVMGGTPASGPTTPPEAGHVPPPVDKKIDFEEAVDRAMRAL